MNSLPVDGEFTSVQIVEFIPDAVHNSDLGPAPNQTDSMEINGTTHSSVLLPDPDINIQKTVQRIVKDVGNDHNVSVNKKGTLILPWPTRNNKPVSEFTTKYFFTLAFPTLFPYGTGDIFINRPRTVSSIGDWAEHLLWYDDGRFAHHPYFKFIVHNMILRKRALENGNCIVQQKLGDAYLTVSGLREKLQNGDDSIVKKNCILVHL